MTSVGHTLVDDNPVIYETSGTVIGGITPTTTTYYVRNVSGNTFQLYTAASPGGSLVPFTSQVTTITVDNPGSGYAGTPNVAITLGGGAGAAAQAIMSGGSVVYIVVTSGGSGFTSNPTVTIDAPGGGGTQATASASIEPTGLHGFFFRKTVNATGVDTVNERINVTSNPFSDNDVVGYSTTGSAIGGISNYTYYRVKNGTSTYFSLASLTSDSIINLSSAGSGTHTFAEMSRVYGSNSEAANRITEYMQIDLLASANIYFRPYYYWNNSGSIPNAHSGLGGAYTTVVPYWTAKPSSSTLWMWGNKDVVGIMIKTATTYRSMFFGHMNKRFWPAIAITSGTLSSGSNTVSVDTTDNFVAGDVYQVVGASGEGREPITLSSIGVGTLTFDSGTVSGTYGAGAYIGKSPSTFFAFEGTTTSHAGNIGTTCTFSATGTADCPASSYTQLYSPIVLNNNLQPEGRSGRYLLIPMQMIATTYAADGMCAYLDEYLYWAANTSSFATEDILGVNQVESGTQAQYSEGASTPYGTLRDDTKSWTPGDYSGKVVIVTGGTGAGQVRKVETNVATALVVSPGWVTKPDNTSAYVICDEVYRSTIYTHFWIREGV